jgi:hypothetical protein
VSYVGSRAGDFAGPPPAQRQEFPLYVKTDARAGVRSGSWVWTIFANNITDRRGALYGNPAMPGGGIYYIQPRTVGVSLKRSF